MIPQVSPWIGEGEAQAVASVVRSGWLTEGSRAEEFTTRLNHYLDAPYGVLAPNGTLALAMALMALGIGDGDEVIVPDSTFVASATACVLAGATPVFVDVTADCYQMDAEALDNVVTKRTRAIMPVWLNGAAPDMDYLQDWACDNEVYVIEDAAQALGSKDCHGMPPGRLTNAACLSFFADKTITTGEGGYVTCRDDQTYRNLLEIRNQGRRERGSFLHPTIGWNFRMTEMQAALGLAQMDRLDTIITRKATIMDWYREGLAETPEVRIVEAMPGSTHVPFRCLIMAESADFLGVWLKEHGVEPRAFFRPLHSQPCFDDFSPHAEPFPNAQYAYEHGVMLPVWPLLTREQVAYICQTVRTFYGHE